MAVISDISLWELFKHLRQWLGNLSRASADRKRQSIDALRAVVVAARHTQVYVRQIEDSGQQNHVTEAQLAEMWTDLGFRLIDLGLTKLAKRCDIKGRYWADPDQFNDEFLQKADVGLESMEQLARQLMTGIDAV